MSAGSTRHSTAQGAVSVLCALSLVAWDCPGYAQQAQAPPPAAPAAQPAAAPAGAAPAEVKLTADQLDSLVAPIALYPDPLLAQTLAASTYPLEIVQLQQWMAKNPNLKDKALADAVAKQPWDPAIQSMAAFPDAVKRLADDIQWTTDLGNAFLAQKSEVMDAIQRMRKKAQGTGALKSSEQVKVEEKVIEQKTVVIVEPSNPEVIYVPSYSPTVVYGPPVYPYPPVYYPPYVPGAAFVSFSFGVMLGAAWGGAWGGCGWGHNDININVNNNFNRNTNINNKSGNRGGNSWQHNSSHRGGTPYGDRATANKFGGTARGDSVSNRSAGGAGSRGAAGVSDRSAGGAGSRGGAGVSDRSTGGASSRGGAGVSDRSAGGAGASTRSTGGGSDRMGSRDIPSSSSSRGSSGFSGGADGFSGRSAGASSSRGSSSFSGGGSMSRGGGGGMSRGGGGGRRR
ncbi:MAG: DUF3300 domain-containing protein [Thermoanaerobaculia bacterium]|nr:DUF3300 domain-containing protein [Thermoanaerobaculia bacterium]